MAFPLVRSTISAGQATGSSAWSLTLPSPIEAGDLILGFLATDGQPVITWDSGSVVGTWTNIAEASNSSGGGVTGTIYGFIADGTEDSAVITVGLDGNERGQWHFLVIQDWQGTFAGVTAASANANNANPNPPNVSAAGGSGDNLFIANFAGDQSLGTLDTFPTNYADNQFGAGLGGTGGAFVGLATRELVASSDDPSVFIRSVAEQYAAFTIVIEPAGGSPATPVVLTPSAIGSMVLTQQVTFAKSLPIGGTGSTAFARQVSYLRSFSLAPSGAVSISKQVGLPRGVTASGDVASQQALGVIQQSASFAATGSVSSSIDTILGQIRVFAASASSALGKHIAKGFNFVATGVQTLIGDGIEPGSGRGILRLMIRPMLRDIPRDK